jgi:hypothetical protein
MSQVMHTQQVADKKTVLAHATQVDDMYDMLAAYEQKTNTADQVCVCGWAHVYTATGMFIGCAKCWCEKV